MSLLKIYFASEQEKQTEDYLYGIQNNKKFILIQCAILVFFTILAYVMTGFNFIMIAFVLLAVFNVVYIQLNIKKSEIELEKKSPKYQVKWYSDLFFFNIKELEKIMTEKNMKQNEISNWRHHYTDSFKQELSLRNFKDVVEKIQKHIGDVNNEPYILNEKAFLKFRKSELSKIREGIFPEIENAIKNGKINIKAKETVKSYVPGNDNLVKNLKILGLSANTRSMNVVDQRYRQLVMLYHPDRSSDEDASEKLAEINVAYNQVKNLLKKN